MSDGGFCHREGDRSPKEMRTESARKDRFLLAQGKTGRLRKEKENLNFKKK